jgi:hypothetical protein
VFHVISVAMVPVALLSLIALSAKMAFTIPIIVVLSV